ncbi:carbonic anhydrase [Oceanibacterium hippocampi]
MDGYRSFLKERYPADAELYRSLADNGQSPQTMVIACCDSRSDPATVFNAGPGQIFVVRNVANLVPPWEPGGEFHGTSAAIEFAVTVLKVRNIVVMGHARCGGISAFLEGLLKDQPPETFVSKWISLLEPAQAELDRLGSDASADERQEAMEYAGIRRSLDNLLSFPFVKERVDTGKLELHGAYFAIATGVLKYLDKSDGRFYPAV